MTIERSWVQFQQPIKEFFDTYIIPMELAILRWQVGKPISKTAVLRTIKCTYHSVANQCIISRLSQDHSKGYGVING